MISSGDFRIGAELFAEHWRVHSGGENPWVWHPAANPLVNILLCRFLGMFDLGLQAQRK